MFRRMLTVLCSVSLISLAGCASTGQNPDFFPPVGSKVIVNQELSARSGSRLYIQNGQAMERRQVGVVNPYCQFVLFRSPEEMSTPFSIQPDTFTITRRYRQRDFSWADGQQVAEIRSNVTMTTFMDLSSDSQPEVRQLLCMRWSSARIDQFVRIHEMQATLAPIVELELLDN